MRGLCYPKRKRFVVAMRRRSHTRGEEEQRTAKDIDTRFNRMILASPQRKARLKKKSFQFHIATSPDDRASPCVCREVRNNVEAMSKELLRPV
jgi:hypothetical protein